MSSIINFIKRRWAQDSNFLNGNCLYFALILKMRFPTLRIYYLPIEGHFCAGDGKSFYDWTGGLTLEEEPILLDDIKKNDPAWYQRLMRDCML